MGKYIITVDAGTTNTRVFLLDKNGVIISSCFEQIGVRNTAIDGNNERLKQAVRTCIRSVIESANITLSDIQIIIASGMITSNVGLVEVPHLIAPVGIEDLASHTKRILLNDVCRLPICFIPGVKNNIFPVNFENFSQMDIMRGEETETIAILMHLKEEKPRTILLPGSHSKFVFIDEKNRITGCLTSLTGELLDSITKHTILKDATDGKFVSEEDYDRTMLIAGYDAGRKSGTGRACFSARILNQFVEKDKSKIANYLLGVVLQNDIAALAASMHTSSGNTNYSQEIIVTGKNSLRKALFDLLQYDGTFDNIHEYQPDSAIPFSVEGAFCIAKHMAY